MAKGLASLNEPLNDDDDGSREERKATGRMVALIVALLLILLAIYHAWIRKVAVLAGVIVPALIMVLYTVWVLFLAKRDKRKRLIAETNLRAEEAMLSEIATSLPGVTKSGTLTTPTTSKNATTSNGTMTLNECRTHDEQLKNKEKCQFDKTKYRIEIERHIMPQSTKLKYIDINTINFNNNDFYNNNKNFYNKNEKSLHSPSTLLSPTKDQKLFRSLSTNN